LHQAMPMKSRNCRSKIGAAQFWVNHSIGDGQCNIGLGWSWVGGHLCWV
jgi:hypothetical protein